MRIGALAALLALAATALSGAAPAAAGSFGPTEGVASWYGAQFHGRRTAHGEIYDKEQLTCAHRSLPFGTFLLVRNLDNSSSVVVRVNDRGPFAKDRILDLSEAAARLLGMIPTGTARVSFSILPPEEALAWRGGALDGAHAPAFSPGAAIAEASRNSASASAGERVRIQVASYRDAANARATRDRLLAAGLEPELESAGAYIRVVFPDLSPDEGRAVSERLETLGYRGFAVVTIRPAASR